MSTIYSDDMYSWDDTTKGLNELSMKKKVPLIGAFEITARCNLSCNMCYVRREATQEILKNERSAEEWIDIGKQASKAGTLFLLITGGEPLIRHDFKIIYEALNTMGFIITLYTNGTLIDEDFIHWISKIPPNKVGITIYGSSPDTYKRVTGNANGYQKTLNGIDLLLKTGITVNLRSTITHDNVNDIEEMNMIAYKKNLKIDHVFNLSNSVRGAKTNVCLNRLTPSEMKDVLLKNTINKKNGIEVFESRIKPSKVNKPILFCSAGRSSYWITWDGMMNFCALMDFPPINLINSNFNIAWDNLKNNVNVIMEPEECKCCDCKEYCSVCPAKLHAETGSFVKTSKYICDMAKMHKEIYHKKEISQ